MSRKQNLLERRVEVGCIKSESSDDLRAFDQTTLWKLKHHLQETNERQPEVKLCQKIMYHNRVQKSDVLGVPPIMPRISGSYPFSMTFPCFTIKHGSISYYSTTTLKTVHHLWNLQLIVPNLTNDDGASEFSCLHGKRFESIS